MKGEKSALPCVGAQDKAEMETGTDMRGTVERVLRRGEEHAIPARELAELCGLSSVRQLQKAIEGERAAGALILSAPTGGYFLPASGEKGKREAARFVGTLRARAINTFRALRAARRALGEVDGQIEMGGLFDG